MKISKIIIQNYRSITKLVLDLEKESNMISLCGANNVGKTNFLRALDLFFSLDAGNFDPDIDIPYHIAKGSRGAGYKTTVSVTFSSDSDTYVITTTFTENKDRGNVLLLEGSKNKENLSNDEIKDFMKTYRFILVESSNIDYSKKIADLVTSEVLLSLDKQRKRQVESLEILKNFIAESKKAVANIEEDISEIVKSFVDDIEGIDPKTWKIKILFPEFNLLREAISNLIDFTLYDTNDRKIDTKGSGIQKILLYSIIDYVSEEARKNDKTIIWGLDEPEAFLQPALQKKVYRKLKEYSKKDQLFLATHSQFMIDLENTVNLFLLESTKELKEYKRRNNEKFYKVNTVLNDKKGIEKIEEIKTNFGISRNDGWQVMPFNLLVEGEDDKQYITSLSKKLGSTPPNMFVAGGASKMHGYLQFLNECCSDISFKPKVICILDHDGEGKIRFSELEHKEYDNFELKTIYIPRHDGDKENSFDYEIEDFVYPELIKEAANKLLRKKKYKTIKKTDFSKRFSPSYDKENILKFMTDITRNNNPDKQPINFESLDIKKSISYYCNNTFIKEMSENKVEELDSSYPQIKEFINKVSKNTFI